MEIFFLMDICQEHIPEESKENKKIKDLKMYFLVLNLFLYISDTL